MEIDVMQRGNCNSARLKYSRLQFCKLVYENDYV